jgi:negative regulator of sigma E activity
MDMLHTDSWQITKTTTMLGRDCFVINGKANEVFDIASYTLTVDKETGALLAYELYDADGALMRQLITYEFKVNEPLPDEIFDNTEKVTMPPFSMLPDE